jgi:hypothetical protein
MRGGAARCPAARRRRRRRPPAPAVARSWAAGAADEDQAPDAVRHADRELERDRRAHRQAEQVGAVQSAVAEHPRGVGGQRRDRHGTEPRRGAPGAAVVVGDDAGVRQVQVRHGIEHRRGDRPSGDQQHRFAGAAVGQEQPWPTACPHRPIRDARARRRSRGTRLAVGQQPNVAAGDFDAPPGAQRPGRPSSPRVGRARLELEQDDVLEHGSSVGVSVDPTAWHRGCPGLIPKPRPQFRGGVPTHARSRRNSNLMSDNFVIHENTTN